MRPKFTFFLIVTVLFMGFYSGYAQTQSVEELRKTVKQIQKNKRMLLRRQTDRQETQRFRTARSYINMNQYNRAIPILEELLQKNPDNYAYYQWLLRAYLTLSRVQSADSLVTLMLERHPGDIRFQIDWANVLYQQEKKEQALQTWNRILNNHPKDLGLYNQVANTMLQNRLLDEAIKVYERAIRNIPNAYHIYQNIASIYQSRLMYAQAAGYYLKYLENQPRQQRYIFSRILSFNIEPDQRPEFFATLEQFAQKSQQSENIYLLMAQLYQRYRGFDKALQIYKRLEKEGRNRNYLLQFAHAAQKDSSYRIALKAYRMIIDKKPDSKTAMSAYQGAVTTLFHLAEQSGNTSYAEQALQMIEIVRTQFPDHPQLAKLKYLQGIFYLDYFFDVDRALSIFNEIVGNPRTPNQNKNEAILKVGECHLIKGQLEQALHTFRKINNPPLQDMALLQIARTYFFMKDWKQAGEVVNTIIQKEGVNSVVTNDALALQMKLNQVQTEPGALAILSESDLLIFQRKKSEALRKLSELVETKKLTPTLRSDVLLKISRLSLDLDNPVQALEYCQKAIQDSGLIRYADQHLFLMGNVLEWNLNRPQEAFDTYRQLLENYPNSLLAQQARDRMKMIREQTPTELP